MLNGVKLSIITIAISTPLAHADFSLLDNITGNKLTISNSGVSLSNSSNGPITLSGVANGVNATDAVNVSQLNNLSITILSSANTYTNQ